MSDAVTTSREPDSHARRSTPGRERAKERAGGTIELREVSVRFGKGEHQVTALSRVDLTIEAGRFVAVLGPSGCGKSTLLNVIAGFERPSHGAAHVDGELVNEPSPKRPVVFQQHSLFPWMSALDNVAFGLRMAGDADARARARNYLRLVGLADFAEHYPAQLSGGMQQRVGLARALAVEPRILLMDEPFGALDAQTRALMQEQLVKLWEEWRHTVVFVTHDIDEAIFLADRVIVLGVKPNVVRGVFDVTVPRPRSSQARQDPAYQALYSALFGLIREESSKTFGSAKGVT